MNATFFSSQDEFREWLKKHHKVETELIVGYYKVGSGKPSMTWSQSVDQALCFGWIDGIRRSIDSERYCIRFTPRRKNSIWGTININKVHELNKAGLMTPVGLEAFNLRSESRNEIYSYEKEVRSLELAFEKQFKKNKKAWEYFINQSAPYRRVTIDWIMSAKQEKTRRSRLEKAIDFSAQEKRVV
jgi:uncharacterized protein YdeI (YjbR/CyaY-like superfamily)